MLNALDEVIRELSAKPSRERRRNGWTNDTREEWRAFFEGMRGRIERGEAPHPRELPGQTGVLKGLDAQGVDVFHDELADLVMDACGRLRRYADEAARAARSRGS